MNTPSLRQTDFYSRFLSVFLLFYLLTGALEAVDALCGMIFHQNPLAGLKVMASLVFALMALGTYSLLGVCPFVPKRDFIGFLGYQVLQVLVSWYVYLVYGPECLGHPIIASLMTMTLALGQVAVALVGISLFQKGWRWTWPWYPGSRLVSRRFSWLTFTQVLGASFALLAAMFIYLGYCCSLSVHRVSADFAELDWNKLILKSKTLQRGDGRTVRLIAMMHVGDEAFYHHIVDSLDPQASILLEGIGDQQHLLKNKLDYKKVAETYHLSAQREQFVPKVARQRSGDVDVSEFSAPTITVLNVLARWLDAPGDPEVNEELRDALQIPNIFEVVLRDIFDHRNRHLLEEINRELEVSNEVVVPWGAAHMPFLLSALQKEGFSVKKTESYPVLFFFGQIRMRRVGSEAGPTTPPAPAGEVAKGCPGAAS